jgi:hypothetical protein
MDQSCKLTDMRLLILVYTLTEKSCMSCMLEACGVTNIWILSARNETLNSNNFYFLYGSLLYQIKHFLK